MINKIFIIIIVIIVIIVIIGTILFGLTFNNDKYLEGLTNNKIINLSPKLSATDVKNLKIGQSRMTEMLRVFDKICMENNITYFAIGGTLLGAYVYKGWIPWDGDLDIEILKSDWPRLNQLLKTHLPKNLWLQTQETDKHYKSWQPNYVMGKIRDINSCYKNCQDGTMFHNGFMLDLNLFYIRDNKLVMPDNLKVNYMTYNDVYPLKRVQFDNIMINIPNNSEKYLIRNYGKKYYNNLPINMRYPHEGILDPHNTCEHHYKLYPNMYKR